MSKRGIVCANCGQGGHVFKSCTKPIISYGVICRKKGDEDRPDTFLVVQRKESFAFVEFMRGKYDPHDPEYVKKLFSGMTEEERVSVCQLDFERLWKTLWSGFKRPRMRQEFEFSKNKYDVISDCIESTVAATTGKEEAEWGFPKGRRASSYESDMDCALREMMEETNVDKGSIDIIGEPVSETFRGSNGTMYTHVYFTADLNNPGVAVQPCAKEIQKILWVTPEDVERLFEDNPTRITAFRKAIETLGQPLSEPV